MCEQGRRREGRPAIHALAAAPPWVVVIVAALGGVGLALIA